MLNELTASPVFGVAITLGVYIAALALNKRVRWAHPLVTTCGGLVALLWLLKVDQPHYQAGGSMVSFMLGPATVALGVPMYKQAKRLKDSLGVLGVAIGAGSLVGMITAGATAALLGAPREIVMSAVPKSVTTPIAMEVARQLHGIPELAAAMAVTAGAIGSLMGPELMRSLRIRHDLAVGAAMGTASHGLGTARCVRDSELQASTASLAMAMAGIATSIMAVSVPWVMQAIEKLQLFHKA
jgi:predicted murein hydrolase (TIGR00659 family)